MRKTGNLHGFHLPVARDNRYERPLSADLAMRKFDFRMAFAMLILYSGMSNMRHLNDLEFCYRMLIDRYAFDPKNIYVLNYDGT